MNNLFLRYFSGEKNRVFRKRYILLFILTVSIYTGWTQDDIIDPVLIRIHAKMVSAADSSPVPYANIINNRTHSGTLTNADGYFTLEMLNIDSLVFKMLPLNYAIPEVQVQGNKPKVDLGLGTGKPVDIDPKLRGNAFNETPPILAAFFNPISSYEVL